MHVNGFKICRYCTYIRMYVISTPKLNFHITHKITGKKWSTISIYLPCELQQGQHQI